MVCGDAHFVNPSDFDPEDEFVEQDGQSVGSDSEDLGNETSHYVEVG